MLHKLQINNIKVQYPDLRVEIITQDIIFFPSHGTISLLKIIYRVCADMSQVKKNAVLYRSIPFAERYVGAKKKKKICYFMQNSNTDI